MPSYLSYKRQMAVLDADDTEIESWITVRGNHIPIKKGQSKEDAVKSFIAGKKKNLVENHNSLVEAMNLEEKGYFKKDPKKRNSITQSAIEMGKEEKNLEELMEFGVKEGNAAKPESKNGTYTYKKGEEVEFYTDVMHDDLAKGKIVGFERSMASHGNKAENQYIIKMPDGSTRTINEKQIDWAKEKSKPEKKRETYKTAEGFEFYKDTNEPVKKGGYTLADKNGNIILQANFVDNTKSYNDKGLYQDALNELDDQIADKEKELENIHLSMTENAEAGYFDIASENMEDIEFVKGQLNELKKKREKLAGSSGNKAPKVTKVDAKKWNSPASDPWKSLYD